MNILHNQAAIDIIGKAVEQLQAIGVDCMVSPLTLPQGASVVLHIGDTVEAIVAADVATSKRAELAHARNTASAFASEVAEGVAAAAIQRASRSAGAGKAAGIL